MVRKNSSLAKILNRESQTYKLNVPIVEKVFFSCLLIGIISNVLYAQNVNPFERPGARKAKPPTVIRQAPTPPAPKPLNPNIEVRGMFFYGNEWYFSLHDRQKNKGAWLKIGESFDGGIVEVIGYRRN